MTLTSALRIATGGMQFNQTGLGNVSHNIVNANTPGYTRQQVQAEAVAYNGFGAGVQLATIQRIADEFINTRALHAGSDLAYATTRRSFLDSVEGAMNGADAQGSLQDLANTFFDALSELANSPADSSLRRNAVQTATLFADTLRGVNADIDTVQTRVDNQITAELETINGVLKRIYELNGQIALAQAGSVSGGNTNDLQDARDKQVAELAQRFKINVSSAANGGIRVLTETGRRLVDESSYVQLKRVSGSGTFADIVAQNVQVDGNLNPALLPMDTVSLTTGTIKSLVDLRDQDIPDLLAQLDRFANTFMAEFNKTYSRGSSVPPQSVLTSHNTAALPSVASDLIATLGTGLLNTSMHISVVDSQGQVIATTVGNGGPFTFPAAGPYTLGDLANDINNNADIGNTILGGNLGVTATATTDAAGRPIIQFETETPGQYVVLSNVSGDPLGFLGMQQFFTGTDSDDIAVSAALQTNPELVAVGRMRSSDGGLSSLNNENALAISQLADTRLTFAAAGGLGTLNLTGGNYLGAITSNLAITMNDANSREQFADTVNNQVSELKGSLSGVNMNEELSQMLVYQNGFQASARIITVVNQLFDTLVSLIR